MMKTFLLAFSLLVSAAWVQAQTYPQTGSSEKGKTASGETTVQGCLQGSGGTYTLTDNAGTTYQLQGDTSKLSDHVGHEVRITGKTMAASGGANPTTGTATSGAQQPTLTVQSVKHIAKTCKTGSMK